jgi:hypothetical protein
MIVFAASLGIIALKLPYLNNLKKNPPLILQLSIKTLPSQSEKN